MRRYLLHWMALTGAFLIAVAACNLVVDPYGLNRIVDSPAFNSTKPKSGTHGPMVKAYQVLRVQPRGLILGNSRSEVGFDPEHPAWPTQAQPAFNLALPGTGTSTTLRYLQHVLANVGSSQTARPEVIVWGIDFMDFLVISEAPNPALARTSDRVKTSNGERLLVNPDGSVNLARASQRAKDLLDSTLTLGALLDSAQTIVSQRDPYAPHLTPLGFNPMRDYLKITADEGYWAVFKAKDLSNMKAYLRYPKDIFDADGRTSPALDDLRQVLRLCRRHGIALHLVIFPYHAHLLEIIRITGHWPSFENWKRSITAIVANESHPHTLDSAVLWDFSGFNAMSMESIPVKGDRRTTMRWYWEAGHFKRQLGDVVLDRILGHRATIPEFGVVLEPANVEDWIASMRAHEFDYRRSHWQEVDELERMAIEIRTRQPMF